MKLIAMDLDKTLLRTDKTVSAYTLDVLGRCRAAGHIVCLATARTELSAQRIIDLVRPDGCVLYGGGYVLWQGKEILRRDIDEATSRRLIAALLASPHIGYLYLSRVGESYSNDPTLADLLDYACNQYIDFATPVDGAFTKITPCYDSLTAIEAIAAQFPDLDILHYGGENMCRFAHRDAVKWNGLSALARHTGVPNDDIIAFGDDYNDVEMLQNAGTGVAVANALSEVKSTANDVCGTNDEDGVAHWLATHVLR